jgi:hypothetical protein
MNESIKINQSSFRKEKKIMIQSLTTRDRLIHGPSHNFDRYVTMVLILQLCLLKIREKKRHHHDNNNNEDPAKSHETKSNSKYQTTTTDHNVLFRNPDVYTATAYSLDNK